MKTIIIISLFLVFSLMFLKSNLFAKERHGVELKIQKIDNQQIRGELVEIKQNSLLLLDFEGGEVSVDVRDINYLKIIKKSKAGLGAISGFLVAGVPIALLLFIEYGDTEPWQALFGLAGAGGLGAVIGTGIGAVAGADKTIQMKGKSDLEITDILTKLRSEASIPDYGTN